MAATKSAVGMFGTKQGLTEAAVFFAGGGIAGAIFKKTAATTVFRAVSTAEAADIASTGTFRAVGSVEGKYFYPTLAQAQNLVKLGWADSVVSARIPTSLITKFDTFDDGSYGAAYFVRQDLLSYFKPGG